MRLPAYLDRKASVAFFVVLLSFFTLVLVADTRSQDATPAPDSVNTTVNPDSLPPEDYPQAATNVEVKDTPNDAGKSISITWDKSVDDHEGGKVKLYRIYRAEVVNGQPGQFKEVGDIPSGKNVYSFQDGNTVDGKEYLYKVAAVNYLKENNNFIWQAVKSTLPVGPVESSAQWFDWRRINAFIGILILSFFIVYFIQQAKSGKELFIRKIAGMEAERSPV